VHVCDSVVIWVTALLLLFALRDRGAVIPAATQSQAGTTGARAADGTPAAVAPGAPLPQDARLR
jgi:hypothetical protein